MSVPLYFLLYFREYFEVYKRRTAVRLYIGVSVFKKELAHIG
jgi:hypothetical protein